MPFFLYILDSVIKLASPPREQKPPPLTPNLARLEIGDLVCLLRKATNLRFSTNHLECRYLTGD